MENLTIKEVIETIKTGKEIEYSKNLTGSEKQIAWALNIKKEMIHGAIKDVMDEVDGYGWDDEDVIEEVQDLVDIVNETSAATIISWHTR
jgi:predicted transcriptional regulator